MKKCVIYSRVSTSNQENENQIGLLKEICERKGFDKLIKGSTKKEWDSILVWSVDRLGRSLKDLVSFLDEINWTLFPLTKSSGLDSYCNQIFEKNNASLFEMGTNNLDKIISLKGKQDMLNPLEKILKATNKITILPISNNINVNMTNLGKYINNYELNKIAVLLE